MATTLTVVVSTAAAFSYSQTTSVNPRVAQPVADLAGAAIIAANNTWGKI